MRSSEKSQTYHLRSTILSHAEYREGRGHVEAERFWEGHYRRQERVWSGRPNPILVGVVGGLRPGTALDLGCGEGGDAKFGENPSTRSGE